MIASQVSLLTALHCIILKCIASEHSCVALCPNCCMAFFFIRVDDTNEAAYELIAEPIQETQAGEHQEDAVEPTSEEVANPTDLQGKPRSITHKFSILMFN